MKYEEAFAKLGPPKDDAPTKDATEKADALQKALDTMAEDVSNWKAEAQGLEKVLAEAKIANAHLAQIA